MTESESEIWNWRMYRERNAANYKVFYLEQEYELILQSLMGRRSPEMTLASKQVDTHFCPLKQDLL